MNNQLYFVNGIWMNRERMEESRGLKSNLDLVEDKERAKAKIINATLGTTKVTEENKELVGDGIDIGEGIVLRPTVEGLRALCDKKGIEYHHASGLPKLKELLGIN